MSEWILWDWNGTLLDDTTAAFNAFNAQLEKRSLKPISLEFYRENFAFPVKPFYSLCGVDLAREDWDLVAAEYHEAYAREPKALNVEAIAALEFVKAKGCHQCILSALRQDLLEEALDYYGVRKYFELVYGVDNLHGASKLARAKELLSVLSSEPVTATLIGDSLHDAEVAAELGIRCVLVATGGHSAARLRAAAPTVNSIMEAAASIFTMDGD